MSQTLQQRPAFLDEPAYLPRVTRHDGRAIEEALAGPTRALDYAVAVTDELSGDEAAAYRAWWLYQAGCAAWLAHDAFGDEAMLPRARDLFGRAAGTGRSVSWFAELAYGELGEEAELEVDRDDLMAIERVHTRLRKIGFHGTGFGRRAHRLRERLEATDEPSQYEEGLKQLGYLLGWDADHPGGENDPDSVWIASDRLALAWEAKSGQEPEGQIGARTVQQAVGHAAWVRDNRMLSEDAVVLPLLVSDRTKLGRGASTHVDDGRLVRLDLVRSLAEDTISVLARVRARAESAEDTAVRSLLVQEFTQAALLPSQLLDRLGQSALTDLI